MLGQRGAVAQQLTMGLQPQLVHLGHRYCFARRHQRVQRVLEFADRRRDEEFFHEGVAQRQRHRCAGRLANRTAGQASDERRPARNGFAHQCARRFGAARRQGMHGVADLMGDHQRTARRGAMNHSDRDSTVSFDNDLVVTAVDYSARRLCGHRGQRRHHSRQRPSGLLRMFRQRCRVSPQADAAI